MRHVDCRAAGLQGHGPDASDGYYLSEEKSSEDEMIFLRAVAEQTAVVKYTQLLATPEDKAC